MKTIREWISILPKDTQDKVIGYVPSPGILSTPQSSFEEAMKGAFSWSDTVEGFNYWMGIWLEFDGEGDNARKQREFNLNILQAKGVVSDALKTLDHPNLIAETGYDHFKRMEADAVAREDYEAAADYRDKINDLC